MYKIDLNSCNVEDVDFSQFTQLKDFQFWSTENLTPNQINQLPTTLKKICLGDYNVADFNFSRFSQLEQIILLDAENFSDEQRAQLPTCCKIYD